MFASRDVCIYFVKKMCAVDFLPCIQAFKRGIVELAVPAIFLCYAPTFFRRCMRKDYLSIVTNYCVHSLFAHGHRPLTVFPVYMYMYVNLDFIFIGAYVPN